MSRAVAVALALALGMVGLAWLELRTPDFELAMSFFTARIPTLPAGEAVITAFAWIVVMIAAPVTLLKVFRTRGRRSARAQTSYVSLLLVAGAMLLTVGALRHSLPATSMCCASGPANVREAIDLAH